MCNAFVNFSVTGWLRISKAETDDRLSLSPVANRMQGVFDANALMRDCVVEETTTDKSNTRVGMRCLYQPNAPTATGLTQERLAELASVPMFFMGHIAHGTRKASLEVAERICKALRISMDSAPMRRLAIRLLRKRTAA